MLAAELQSANGNHHAAFASYQRRMQNFVTGNQQIAVGNASSFVPAIRRQIWLQNQAIKALPYMPGKNFVLRQATQGSPGGC